MDQDQHLAEAPHHPLVHVRHVYVLPAVARTRIDEAALGHSRISAGNLLPTRRLKQSGRINTSDHMSTHIPLVCVI